MAVLEKPKVAFLATKNIPKPAVIIQDEDTQSSQISQPQTEVATIPPNGGLLAWLQVLGAFFFFFNPW